MAETGLEGTKAATGVEVLDCRDSEETEPREEEEGFWFCLDGWGGCGEYDCMGLCGNC